MTLPALRRATVAGATLAYRRAGAGPPLLLLHGGWSDSRDWRPQLASLADAFDVVAWDAPGCGGSDDPPAGADLGAYADAAAGLAAALRLDRPHVAGASFGGGLALGACRDSRPHVRRLRTGALRRPRRRPCGPAWASGRGHPEGLVFARRAARPWFRDRLLSCSGAIPACRGPWCSWAPLAGAEDARSPRPVAEALHAGIPGSELVLVPGAGHLLNIEAPELFDAEVRRFLQAVDRGGG